MTIWSIGITALLLLNHIHVPNFPSYLSSYLGSTLDSEKYYWILYVSYATQVCALFPILLVFNHFHFLCFTFAQSMSIALDLICSPFVSNFIENEFRSSQVLSKSKLAVDENDLNWTLANCINQFQSLENLTEYFNKTYKWMFFLYKGIIMINLCILIFVPLRFSRLFPTISILVFFISAMFFVFHLTTVLPTMGKVWTGSLKFQKLWVKRLPSLINTDSDIESIHEFLKVKGELEGCLPFGIDCGSFYTVTPVSVLVFFSISTSYLIVLLQLDIK